MRLLSSCALSFVLGGFCSVSLLCQNWPTACVGTDQQAAEGLNYLQAHHEDTERASCLLAYYILIIWPRVQQDRSLREDRMRLMSWVIENHPDIKLTRDNRGLYVNPEDNEEYDAVRELSAAG